MGWFGTGGAGWVGPEPEEQDGSDWNRRLMCDEVVAVDVRRGG